MVTKLCAGGNYVRKAYLLTEKPYVSVPPIFDAMYVQYFACILTVSNAHAVYQCDLVYIACVCNLILSASKIPF